MFCWETNKQKKNETFPTKNNYLCLIWPFCLFFEGPRIRRALKKQQGGEVSMPVHRSNSLIGKESQEKIDSGHFNLGVPVLETEYTKLVITSEGKIEKRPCKLTARKYPLSEVREKCLLKNEKYVRLRSDEEYDVLGAEDVKKRLISLSEMKACEGGSPDELRQHLKEVERTRHWLIWHVHAGVASDGLLLFLLRELYDPAIHLTSEEFMAKKQPHQKDRHSSRSGTASSVHDGCVWQFRC